MGERKKLVDILRGSDRESLARQWNETAAAADFAPLPPGEYETVVISGELFTAKTGTAGYKLTFEVSHGDFKGRKLWHDMWLTPAALPLAKRDLAKIGVKDFAQMERSLPARFQCKVKLALRKNEEGGEYNRVLSFECAGVEEADPFGPPTERGEGNTDDDDDDDFDGHGDAYEPPPAGDGFLKNGCCPGPYDAGERR